MKEVIVSKTDETKMSNILVEGVSYDKESQTFTFDFLHENKIDILPMTRQVHQLNAFGNCYYYGYEFSDNVDHTLRTRFLKYIKFDRDFQNQEDFNSFIYNAVTALDDAISLPMYDVFVYPESMSELNRRILSNMARIAQPTVVSMELVKEIPSKIEFDYDRFETEFLSAKNPDGYPKYTEHAKKQIVDNVHELMDMVHQKDYFSIARDIKKNKYRSFLKNFYKFKDEKDKVLYQTLLNSNVLLFDDVVTTGSTIYYLLNSLRSVNDNNKIVIFSLIGSKKANQII